MADSTVFSKSSDVMKMKVIDLKKELKMRGLSTAGDKSELAARLQSALNKDSLTEDALDSDELDLDGVLGDDDDEDKNVSDLINDDIITESVVSGSSSVILENAIDSPDTVSGNTVTVPQSTRIMKRRSPSKISSADSLIDDKDLAPTIQSTLKRSISAKSDDSTPAKKIVLNRAPIVAIVSSNQDSSAVTDSGSKSEIVSDIEPKVTKLSLDPKTRLEMRAKRFGLPPTETALKEIRKARFTSDITGAVDTNSPQRITYASTTSLDVLKKRAERFGTSVSKIMVDVENQEKLAKRKAKFGAIKS